MPFNPLPPPPRTLSIPVSLMPPAEVTWSFSSSCYWAAAHSLHNRMGRPFSLYSLNQFSILLCASQLTPTDCATGFPCIQSTGGRTGDLGAQGRGFPPLLSPSLPGCSLAGPSNCGHSCWGHLFSSHTGLTPCLPLLSLQACKWESFPAPPLSPC